MPELLDIVTRDVLIAATTVQYANGRASQSAVISGDFLNLVELRRAKRTLKRNNAKPAEDGKYVVIGNPDTSFDLEGDSNITNVWVTGGGLGKGPDYFDATFKDLPLGFRYYESTIAPITRASGYTDYYHTFVLGAEAYGTAELSSMPAKVITHLPGTSGVSDPLDQVATVGEFLADLKPIKFRGTPRERTILSQASAKVIDFVAYRQAKEGATTRRWGLGLAA